MSDDLPDFSRLPEDSAKDLHKAGIGMLVLLVALLLLAIVYTIGEKMEGFRWHTLRNGLFSFGVIILSVCVTVIGITAAIRGIAYLWPEALQHLADRRELKNARRAAADAISEKHRLTEERARLTAQLQATFLFEKETIRTANAQASREFREALQSSVLRSCEIAFEHINTVVEQYEQVVAEIEAASLPAAEKTELLNSLIQQLDISAAEDRNRDARRMMESEIWKVRFRKARMMAKDKSDAAIRYLERIREEARGTKRKAKITELIQTLTQKDCGRNQPKTSV